MKVAPSPSSSSSSQSVPIDENSDKKMPTSDISETNGTPTPEVSTDGNKTEIRNILEVSNNPKDSDANITATVNKLSIRSPHPTTPTINSPGKTASISNFSAIPTIPNLQSLPNDASININNPPVSPDCLHTSDSLLHNTTRAAVDMALASERTRTQALEANEIDYTAAELRIALRKERSRSSRLAAELAGLRSAAVAGQAEAEIREEGRINQLMRRLDGLQKEKGRIIVELEREEEMLTNTLQKKLAVVRKEKALLEKQMERERKAEKDRKLEREKKTVSSP